MGEEIYEEGRKFSTLSPGPVKIQKVDIQIAAPTPEKINESSSLTKNREKAAEVPEKYRILAEYFDRMTCSWRLLSLRKKPPTFQNISRQVEVLMKREFSYKHLAQIKYLLPEAVEIHRILVHDDKTLCMVPGPDVTVTLLFDVVEGHEKSSFTALRDMFESRLLDFSRTHPEGCEVPEAEIPEPVKQESERIGTNQCVDTSTNFQQSNSESELLLSSSHLNPSFNRHFSQKVVAETEQKTQLLAILVPYDSSNSVTDQISESEENTVSAQICPESTSTSIACENTPLKPVHDSDNILLQTPALSVPPRSVPSCDNKLQTVTSQNLAHASLSAKRVLDFTFPGGEDTSLSSVNVCSEVTVLQSVETKEILLKDNFSGSPELLKKSEASCAGINHNMSQNHPPVDEQMSALITSIYQVFQSRNFSSITKDELLHKILMNQFDLIDKREVEELIERLEKLVPGWIYKKLAPSGDLLYNIKKVSDLNSIRQSIITK